MKIILVGYPGSQKLVPVSKYLVEKYLPGFEVRYLNHTGNVSDWSAFVATYLELLDDEKIIFALDDYLIRAPIDMKRYKEALTLKPCVKLFTCTEQEHREYPVTTQYTIWDRKELMELLKQTSSPWDFEINGSKLFKGTSTLLPCLDYDTSSALSPRWSGVRLNLNEEDLVAIENL